MGRTPFIMTREFCRIFFIDGIFMLWPVFLTIFGLLCILSLLFYLCETSVGFKDQAQTISYSMQVDSSRVTIVIPTSDDPLEAFRALLRSHVGVLPGKGPAEMLLNASYVTFLATTVGLGEYQPRTVYGKLVVLLAGCAGLVVFGMLAGIAFVAGRQAYLIAHGKSNILQGDQ